MPRWLVGGTLIVYLAGMFGFGLSYHFTEAEVSVLNAIGYGAGWPIVLLRALGLA